MKMIKNMALLPINNQNKEYLLINTLYGLVDVLSEKEYGTIKYFQSLGEIDETQLKTEEKIFYHQLARRFYIMDAEMEIKIEDRLLEKLRIENKQNEENLSSVFFILSYACNFSCPYCYESKGEHGMEIITKEQVDKIFKLYPQGIKKITLFGGEPLLERNREIIKYIIQKSPDAYYGVVTNGFYLYEFLDILKNLKISYIQVTLDGGKETHNKSRILKNGQPTYVKIMQGVEACLKEGLLVKIRMNISGENINECLKTREELTEKYIQYKDKLIFELQPIFQIDDKEKQSLWDRLYTDISKDCIEMGRRNHILQTFPALTNFFITGNRFKPLYRFCQLEEQTRYFDPQGDIYSCIIAVGDTKKSIGKYFPEIKLKEKSMITRNIETISECRNCSNKFICGGGCPNAIEGDDCFKPNCYNLQNELSNAIPLVYAIKEGKK